MTRAASGTETEAWLWYCDRRSRLLRLDENCLLASTEIPLNLTSSRLAAFAATLLARTRNVVPLRARRRDRPWI